MSYHIYHTEALILGGKAAGEGDRVLYCYTRELGLILAHAKSLRENHSKLISAYPIDSFTSLWRHPSKRKIVAAHAQLLRRLIQGEERHELLFDDLLSGLRFLSGIENEAELRAGELIFVVRMLSRLGYWGDAVRFPQLALENVWTAELLSFAQKARTPLILGINQALELSHL